MEKQWTCPKCKTSEPPNLKNGLHECPKCGIFYEKMQPGPSPPQDLPRFVDETDQPMAVWPFFLVPAVAASSIAAHLIGKDFGGMEYIGFYCIILLFFLISLLIFRKLVADSFFVRLVFLIGFESIGISRFFYGINHRMYEFEYLVFIMVVGGALLFFIFSYYQGDFGRRSGRRSGGCGCSSCGGGCGGCGGD